MAAPVLFYKTTGYCLSSERLISISNAALSPTHFTIKISSCKHFQKINAAIDTEDGLM